MYYLKRWWPCWFKLLQNSKVSRDLTISKWANQWVKVSTASFHSFLEKERDGNKKERKTQNLHEGETEEKWVFVLHVSWSFNGNKIQAFFSWQVVSKHLLVRDRVGFWYVSWSVPPDITVNLSSYVFSFHMITIKQMWLSHLVCSFLHSGFHHSSPPPPPPMIINFLLNHLQSYITSNIQKHKRFR